MAEDLFIPRRFSVTLATYPPFAMAQSSALELAKSLGAKHALTDIHMSDETWEYNRPIVAEGEPRGLVRVRVQQNEIEITHRFPPTGLERFESFAEQVLTSFQSPFVPQFVFGMTIDLGYVFSLKADSRDALLKELGLDSDGEGESRIGAFNRPCHFVGLRLGFGPYRVVEADDPAPPSQESAEGLAEQLFHGGNESTGQQADAPPDRGAEWQATVTLSSLPEDPTKLLVEIESEWPGPVPWDDAYGKLTQRIDESQKFLRDKVRTFIAHFQQEGDGHEDNND